MKMGVLHGVDLTGSGRVPSGINEIFKTIIRPHQIGQPKKL
jgi:hypothetical protein